MQFDESTFLDMYEHTFEALMESIFKQYPLSTSRIEEAKKKEVILTTYWADLLRSSSMVAVCSALQIYHEQLRGELAKHGIDIGDLE